jgi:hypothetical protein
VISTLGNEARRHPDFEPACIAQPVQVCTPSSPLRDRKIITFTILEEENGSDREDFSEGSISRIPLRKNLLEMDRFFPREL